MSNIRNTDTRQLIINGVRVLLVALPLLCGFFNQLLMWWSGQVSGIPVYVNPPGEIRPQISLEGSWWIAMVLGTIFLMVFCYLNKMRSVQRTIYPLYIFLIFLVIIVKPV